MVWGGCGPQRPSHQAPWLPPPTPARPRLVVGKHSRLTLMFVLRLEVVCPVVCGEGGRCLGHSSLPAFPGPRESAPKPLAPGGALDPAG